MNDKKRLSIYMTRSETFWGWTYMPFYLFLLSMILDLVSEALGLDIHTPKGASWQNALFFSINFLAVVVIFHDFLKKSFFRIGKSFWGFVQAVLLGLVMHYAGSIIVNTTVVLIQPDFANVNNQHIQTMASANPWIMLVGAVFLVPVTEECLIRGLIFQGLFRKNRIFAYVVSSVLFCLLHIIGYVGSYSWQTLLLCTVQYLPPSISLAWAYEKADTIFAPITMHCLINAITYGQLNGL